MYILGISAFYHDSAAVLLKDGIVICAIEEERLSRIKHDNRFPSMAIQKCLEVAKITPDKIDLVSFYEKPLLKLERNLDLFVDTFPNSFTIFKNNISHIITQKITIKNHLKKIGIKNTVDIHYIPHHMSHAAASFYTSPFNNACIVIIDGVGEYDTTSIWSGNGTKIVKIASLQFPHSLGLLYSTITSFLGFKVNNDEYKVMALAALGQSKFTSRFEKIINLNDDGSFNLNLQYFDFTKEQRMWSKELEKELGLPRHDNQPISKKYKDLAASLQSITEKALINIIKYASKETRSHNLCLGGGVALNAVANGKIFSNTTIKDVSIFGASGDSGAALGAALVSWHQKNLHSEKNEITNLSLGTKYSNEEIKRQLSKSKNLSIKEYEDEETFIYEIAKLLKTGKIIGVFQDKLEFGPRALGNRSILADPMRRGVKQKLNRKKGRESYRPFGLVLLERDVGTFFKVDKTGKGSFPNMNFCFTVNKAGLKAFSDIVHRDNTIRVQTITSEQTFMYKLLNCCKKKFKIPALVNTSFNQNGEPIVENPEQALNAFKKLKLDYLVIGKCLVTNSYTKKENVG